MRGKWLPPAAWSGNNNLFTDVWMHPSLYGHELTAIQLKAFLDSNEFVPAVKD